MKNIYLYSNEDKISLDCKNNLKELININKLNAIDCFNDEVEMMVVIGGDGTFLRAIKDTNYPNIPILGINTGHLGFYSEYNPSDLSMVIEVIKNNDYILQTYKTIKTIVNDDTVLNPALNDVLIRHGEDSIVHLDLFVDEELIESLAGDGLLISSSAGSTAYNYSLGGSIIDPSVNALEITPVAPNNNVVYRSINSSLIVGKDKKITIMPKDINNTVIVVDGNKQTLNNIKKIEIELFDKEIHVVRSSNYSFFKKVKSKFI